MKIEFNQRKSNDLFYKMQLIIIYGSRTLWIKKTVLIHGHPSFKSARLIYCQFDCQIIAGWCMDNNHTTSMPSFWPLPFWFSLSESILWLGIAVSITRCWLWMKGYESQYKTHLCLPVTTCARTVALFSIDLIAIQLALHLFIVPI